MAVKHWFWLPYCKLFYERNTIIQLTLTDKYRRVYVDMRIKTSCTMGGALEHSTKLLQYTAIM